ncbi:hypothetical protein Tco_0669925 [Tanacetum coccineum]
MTTSLSYAPDDNDEDDNRIDETKTLISALSFLSRNLPLPPDVFDAVNSIYENGHGSDHLHHDDDELAFYVLLLVNCLFIGVTERLWLVIVDGDFELSYSEVMVRVMLQSESDEVDDDSLILSLCLMNEMVDNGLFTNGGDLMADLEDALAKQQNHMTGAEMAEARKKRIESHIQTRLTQLEDLPTSRGEDLQTKCLIELYGLKVNSSLEVLAFSYFLLYLKIFRMLEMFDLAELQRKVRSNVSSEYMLCLNCANPEKQLFDWGNMRLPRFPYGVGDAFAVDSDNHLKKKRDADVLFYFLLSLFCPSLL